MKVKPKDLDEKSTLIKIVILKLLIQAKSSQSVKLFNTSQITRYFILFYFYTGNSIFYIFLYWKSVQFILLLNIKLSIGFSIVLPFKYIYIYKVSWYFLVFSRHLNSNLPSLIISYKYWIKKKKKLETKF